MQPQTAVDCGYEHATRRLIDDPGAHEERAVSGRTARNFRALGGDVAVEIAYEHQRTVPSFDVDILAVDEDTRDQAWLRHAIAAKWQPSEDTARRSADGDGPVPETVENGRLAPKAQRNGLRHTLRQRLECG